MRNRLNFTGFNLPVTFQCKRDRLRIVGFSLIGIRQTLPQRFGQQRPLFWGQPQGFCGDLVYTHRFSRIFENILHKEIWKLLKNHARNIALHVLLAILAFIRSVHGLISSILSPDMVASVVTSSRMNADYGQE